MYYRTKTYIAGAWDEDNDAISQLYKWKGSDYWSFDFVDAHDLTLSRDSSNPCSIKASLRLRMQHSKTFVLIVGPKTKSIRKGSCYYCNHYYNYRCYLGSNISFDSFIEYECKKAIRDNMKILVLYNSIYVHRDWCPESIRFEGIHFSMKDNEGRYDYQKVLNAFKLLED